MFLKYSVIDHSDFSNDLIKTNEPILMDPTMNNHQIAQNNFNIHNENDFLIHHTTTMFQEEDLGKNFLFK
jgi:hypothetical protein